MTNELIKNDSRELRKTQVLNLPELQNDIIFIFNESFSKEDYFEKIRNLKNSPHSIQQFENLKKTIPRRFAYIRHSEAVTGDYILNSKEMKRALVCFFHPAIFKLRRWQSHTP